MIKAIETSYRGYRMRSRLEARWGVFFDALGIEWEYEPQGFELFGGERYLPDFWLAVRPGAKRAGSGYWVEIKGQEPTQREIEMLKTVCVGTEHNGYLFSGLPGQRDWTFCHRSGAVRRKPEPALVTEHMGRDCWFTMEFPWDRCANPRPQDRWFSHIAQAIAAARSARFEFGESGASA